MRFAATIGLALTLTSPALAEDAEGCFGPGQPLFHCPAAKGKRIDLCLQGSTVYYRFGPAKGAAEMILARPVEEVALTPWPGVGGTFWEELTLPNGAYGYLLYHSAERQPDGLRQGGVVIQKDGQEIARVKCTENAVNADFLPLFEAKEAAGQSYCRDSGEWKARCD